MIRCFAHWCDQSWEIFMFGIKSSEAVSRTYWLVWLIMPVHLVFDTPTYSSWLLKGCWDFCDKCHKNLSSPSNYGQRVTNTHYAPTLVCCAWGENLTTAELLGSSSWAIEVVGSSSEPQREHVAHLSKIKNDDQGMLRSPLYFPSNGVKEALRSHLYF